MLQPIHVFGRLESFVKLVTARFRQKISGGREAQHATPGDVLIFRGQPVGVAIESEAFGVAHRSPDMVEGQRRMVLTMDVGDLRGSVAAAQPST